MLMMDPLYDWLIDGFTWLVIKLGIMWIESKIFVIQFFWEMSQKVIDMFTIYPLIQQAIDMLSPQYSGFLFFLGLDQALAIVLQALMTRFALRALNL
ncbi:accessory cholera enterotoxin [Vibrio cholerae O395]|nr:accessory cholera enterotoxin [Vibrio cholerae O395]